MKDYGLKKLKYKSLTIQWRQRVSEPREWEMEWLPFGMSGECWQITNGDPSAEQSEHVLVVESTIYKEIETLKASYNKAVEALKLCVLGYDEDVVIETLKDLGEEYKRNKLCGHIKWDED